MGITAGENIEPKMGALSKEQWLWQAYGENIRDALKEQPNRKFRFIQPLLYNRVGAVDIPKLAAQAAADIESARHWEPGNIETIPPRKTRGGRP